VTANLQQWLTLQASRRPDSVAVRHGEKGITYGQLDQVSNQVARGLKAAGCRPKDRVGLFIPKSIEALIGMFGALKAQCIYVPLDTAGPATRLARILKACECRLVVAVEGSAPMLQQTMATMGDSFPRIGWIDGGTPVKGATAAFSWRDLRRLSGASLGSQSSDADAAHILFTSGSTGVPKGVVITHGNIIHFVEWAIRHFGMDSSDKISGHPPLHFDLSMFDVYGSMAAGAELHLVPSELSLLPHKLAAFIRDSKLTQWFSVPSALHHLAKFDAVQQDDFPALRRLLWCGEKFPTPALMYWMRRIPHVQFFNLYGPTEATIASSCYRVPSCPGDEREEIPIGDACAGERLLVLDETLNPVAPEETGHLYIGGVGLSPGYWRDPEKTAEVFLSSPEGRIYKTGDLAKVAKDGAIYLLGRADSQIKARGYRIELGEIEKALHAETGIADAAVVAIESPGFEGLYICCAYVAKPGVDLTPLALKQRLAKSLPAYMLPGRWMALERMPLNSNGKTDRRQLKEDFLAQAAVGAPKLEKRTHAAH
jgi:amino acid adenylation domain-containing protein